MMAGRAGEADPAAKRKIIRWLFIGVYEEQGGKFRGIRWLAQGTVCPDVIESAGAKTGKAQVINSHHNVAGLLERMHLFMTAHWVRLPYEFLDHVARRLWAGISKRPGGYAKERDYPAPIVRHEQARQRTLARFKAVRGSPG